MELKGKLFAKRRSNHHISSKNLIESGRSCLENLRKPGLKDVSSSSLMKLTLPSGHSLPKSTLIRVITCMLTKCAFTLATIQSL